MEKILRKFSSHEEMRAESYRYWASRSMGEVLDATAELSEAAWSEWYKLHNITPPAEDAPRILIRTKRKIR